MPTTPLQPIPYLIFNGACAEAIDFYAAAFGGTIASKMTFGQMPGAEQLPPEVASRIMNVRLNLPGGGYFYGGDCPPQMAYPGIQVDLTLHFDSVEEAETIFNRLAEGGQISMPFAPTFWAEKFGMVTDKFGVGWMVNGVMKQM